MTDFFNLPPEMRLLFVNNGINLIAAILILVIGWTVARLAGRWARIGLDRIPHFDATLRPLVASFIRYGIIAVTIIAVLQRFGVETTSLIAILGAAGIAVGLALQGTLSNVAAGVMLLLVRPFRVGDKIRAGDTIGVVREIELFRTIVITDDLLYLSVPNSTLFAATIYNLYKERALLNADDLGMWAVGFVASFISAFLCVRWLLRYISSHDFTPFAWYRIVFGIVVLATAQFGWVEWTVH